MPVFYLDTSALAKRYIQEKGSEVVDELFDRLQDTDFLTISLLAVVELKSVFKRLVKGRLLRETQMAMLLSEFSSDQAVISEVVEVDTSLLEEAALILDRHSLKAGDAIHLACILRFKSVAPAANMIVVTSDQELSITCIAEGIEILNPEDDKALDRLQQIRSMRS